MYSVSVSETADCNKPHTFLILDSIGIFDHIVLKVKPIHKMLTKNSIGELTLDKKSSLDLMES